MSARTSRADMVHTMCAQVDAGDATGFASWFAPDATYVFGNTPAVVGRDAVEAATAAAVASLPWVRHEVDQVAEVGEQLFCRFTIHTAAPSGEEVALPCVTVIEMTGEQVTDYRVHMDLSPAFAPPLGLAPADPAAVAVAAEAFRGLQRGAATGDWSGFVDLLAEDVTIMIPVPAHEENPPEGVLRGKDIARMLFAGHHEELVTGVVLQAHRIAANGPLVVLEARVEGALAGEVVANHFVFAFEVRDGLIASMYEYASWTAKNEASGWGDPTFAREAWAETLIPASASAAV
jgi:uncharacterized protein (TIGR02246 family)